MTVPQHGYGQAYAVAPTPPTSTMAILSLVLSITGVTILPVIGSVIGVVTGHIALNQLRSSGESGRGLAVAGLVVGYVGLTLLVVVGVMIAYALLGLGGLVWLYS